MYPLKRLYSFSVSKLTLAISKMDGHGLSSESLPKNKGDTTLATEGGDLTIKSSNNM